MAQTEYQQGDLVEVGMGVMEEGTGEVEDGRSAFFFVDRPSITEDELVTLFENDQNVLYVQLAVDEQSKEWARENPLSSMI